MGVNQADMFAKAAAASADPELPLPPSADTISKLEFNNSVLLAGCGWDGEVRAAWQHFGSRSQTKPCLLAIRAGSSLEHERKDTSWVQKLHSTCA